MKLSQLAYCREELSLPSTISLYQLNCVLPKKVCVTFPMASLSSGFPSFAGQGYIMPRFTQNCSLFYESFVNISSFSIAGKVLQGNGGIKLFHDTAKALFCFADPRTILNKAKLDKLARQIALDFINWTYAGVDMSLDGIHGQWAQDGANDVTFVFREDQCFTRCQRYPWNWSVVEFNHSFLWQPYTCGGGGGGSSSSSGSASSSSSSSGTSSNCIFCVKLVCCDGQTRQFPLDTFATDSTGGICQNGPCRHPPDCPAHPGG